MTFTPDIYAQIHDGAERSARIVVPLVCSLADHRTVVDVGCGEGLWASAFAARGNQVVAIDESIKEPWFRAWDGESGGGRVDYFPASLDPWRTVPDVDARAPYELALCLEVAEHLSPEAAQPLVDKLCQLAPTVLFSAAIPGQGGHGHRNEQWPAYWATLFAFNGYVTDDTLRWRIWDDDEIEPWYRQNLMLFEHRPGTSPVVMPPPVVHPVVFTHIRALFDAAR